MNTPETLTAASLELFLEFAKDACNWNGYPLVDGNVVLGSEGRGNLTQLKRAGLLSTFREDGCLWVQFSELGVKFAAKHGVTIQL